MATRKLGDEPLTTQPLRRLRDRLERLQGEADLALRRTRRKAATATKGNQRLRLGHIARQARRLRHDLEGRAQDAGKTIGQRAGQLAGQLEDRLAMRLETLLERLDFATRGETAQIVRRLHNLEHQLQAGNSRPVKRAASRTTRAKRPPSKRRARPPEKPRTRR